MDLIDESNQGMESRNRIKESNQGIESTKPIKILKTLSVTVFYWNIVLNAELFPLTNSLDNSDDHVPPYVFWPGSPSSAKESANFRVTVNYLATEPLSQEISQNKNKSNNWNVLSLHSKKNIKHIDTTHIGDIFLLFVVVFWGFLVEFNVGWRSGKVSDWISSNFHRHPTSGSPKSAKHVIPRDIFYSSSRSKFFPHV